MSAAEAREVVVVGGGPAGSAASLLLRRMGHDVLLLDAARFPRDKVCGESVSPAAWPLLTGLGVAGALQERRPHPIRGMRVVSPDGTSFTGRYPAAASPGFGLRRTTLDALLLQAARQAGVEVREGVRVTSPWLDEGRVGGVRCEGPAGVPSAVEARLVVAADGRSSRLGHALGLLRADRRLRKFAVRGHWTGVEGLEELGEMHVVRGGYCGIAPLSSSEANVAFVLDRAAMADAAGDLAGFYRGSIDRRWPALAERLRRARLQAPARVVGPLGAVAPRPWLPGLLLVGDAAGFLDPFTGEGITLALKTAQLAAHAAHGALAAGCTDDLSAYGRARDGAMRDKHRLNRLLLELVAWPALASLAARRLARRPELADQLVCIAGDFLSPRTALNASFWWRLLAP